MLEPPLLTYDLYDAFLDAINDLSDENLMVDKLCSCVMKLPPLNHDILAELLQLLMVIMEYQDKNRMGVDNLATVFGPCLMHKQTVNGMTDIMNLSKEAEVVALLLRNAARIVKLERVGARPRDTGDSSTSFPGVRLLSNPNFSSSPVLGRKGAIVFFVFVLLFFFLKELLRILRLPRRPNCRLRRKEYLLSPPSKSK
jgi:hypothetical protein